MQKNLEETAEEVQGIQDSLQLIDVDAEYEKAIARADKLYDADLARLDVNKEKGEKMQEDYEAKVAKETESANA